MFGLQMGFSKKSQIDNGLEGEGKKWVIVGIPARGSLKPIITKAPRPDIDDDGSSEKSISTTPTAKEARISDKLSCPPAPRKRRSLKSNSNHVRDFFNPPDLESVFKLRV